MANITTLLDKLSRFWETANVMDSEVVSLSVNEHGIRVQVEERGFRCIVGQHRINLDNAMRTHYQGREHVTVEHDGVQIITIMEPNQ